MQSSCLFFFTHMSVHMKEGDVSYFVGFKHSSKQTFKNSKKLVWEAEYVAFCSLSRRKATMTTTHVPPTPRPPILQLPTLFFWLRFVFCFFFLKIGEL